MKEFPRIHSLSTLGLIHHQEFDYKFHPFRTDFIGESGAGKSIIADLIQLIFVGSDAFESATKATGERKPSGMVLETAGGRNNNIGYAFLNIETTPSSFLVVGAYIETGSRSTESFIIHASYDIEPVTFLNAPLSYKDFIQNDELLPIDLLKDFMASNDLFCNSWKHPKKFHDILYKQKIVPLDLASSDKTLKDYAGILQAFSRGKTLDTQKSRSLKMFLFGNESAKEIFSKFKDGVKDMEDTIGAYGSNLKEIELVTSKQKALVSLKGLKEDRDTKQKTWLTQNLFFWDQETDRLRRDYEECLREYTIAKQHRLVLEELLISEMALLKEYLPTLSSKREAAETAYGTILPQYRNVEVVEKWLADLNCSIKELKDKYDENKSNRVLQDELRKLTDLLRNGGVYKHFEEIPDKDSYASITSYLTTEFSRIKTVISQKLSLKKYTNINEPDSLPNWAIRQNRIFTIDEESALLRFQTLPRKKPDDRSDYLPFPEELFDELKIVEREEKGIWINLQGIYAYAKYTPTQILNTTDEEKIRSYFSNYTQTIDRDVAELNQRKDQLLSIQDILNSMENPSVALNAHQQRESLSQFKTIESLNISDEAFTEHLDSYTQRDYIYAEHTRAKTQFGKINNDLTKMNRLHEDLTNSFDFIKALPTLNEEALGIVVNYKYEGINSDALKQSMVSELKRTDEKAIFFKDTIDKIKPKLSIGNEAPAKQIAWSNSIKEYEKAKDCYEKHYTLPDTFASDTFLGEPKEEYSAYITSEAAYVFSFKNVVQQFLPSETYRYSESDDFNGMAKSLLPEAFHGTIVTAMDGSVIETIGNYLMQINEKNRQLNGRKVQKIKDILNDVDLAISYHENTVRRIDNFLKSRSTITGGFSARLKRTTTNNYPRGWMNAFRQVLEDEVSNPSSLSNRLSEKVDLEQMMKTAFHYCGGPSSVDASISTLLDPATYYDLSFTMESKGGRINMGSTGQTYAAIALLCIARLSVMSQVEGAQIEPAVRVMPIDEAEGLGSNYDMLYDIAREYDYQIISLSIGPVGKFKEGEQYIYMLHKNMEVESEMNYTPMAIFCEKDMTEFGSML